VAELSRWKRPEESDVFVNDHQPNIDHALKLGWSKAEIEPKAEPKKTASRAKKTEAK